MRRENPIKSRNNRRRVTAPRLFGLGVLVLFRTRLKSIFPQHPQFLEFAYHLLLHSIRSCAFVSADGGKKRKILPATFDIAVSKRPAVVLEHGSANVDLGCAEGSFLKNCIANTTTDFKQIREGFLS